VPFILGFMAFVGVCVLIHKARNRSRSRTQLPRMNAHSRDLASAVSKSQEKAKQEGRWPSDQYRSQNTTSFDIGDGLIDIDVSDTIDSFSSGHDSHSSDFGGDGGSSGGDD
jgi:hypothetical protein